MSFVYKLHPEAQKEYEDSVIWYADRNLSAAVGFVDAVERALKLICDYPLLWRNEYKHFYEYNLKKYPFTVIYFIEDSNGTIIVSAIYHQKRIPTNKYRK
jgi:plasmid stabilization system protein ParE